MNSKILFVLFALAVFNIQPSEQLPPIGGDIFSLLRIVGRLCIPGNHSDAVAQKFFACYDQAPGKQQFVDCQTKTFGGPLNTKTNIDAACRNLCKLPAYAICLKQAFQAAGLDQQDAVTKVNICQGQALGF